MQCLNLQQALFLAQNASLASMKIKKPKLCSGRTTPSRSWNQCSSLVKNNHLSKETVSSLFVTAQLYEDITRKAEIGSLCLSRVTPESSKHKKGETLNDAFCKTMAKKLFAKNQIRSIADSHVLSHVWVQRMTIYIHGLLRLSNRKE